MTDLRNELPVAVHLASGGDARLRTGGEVISLNGISSASFQMINSTRFRAFFSNRSMGGLVLLIGYTAPVTLANASWMGSDSALFTDDVPEGTTIHISTVNPEDYTSAPGGAFDALHVSFYG